MKAFEFKRGTGNWPAGETLWHVYALPDLGRDAGLAALVAGCRQALDGFPMTMVDHPWLHVTIAQITDATGSSTSTEELRALETELRRALGVIRPFTVMVGSCLSYPSGAIFDLSPDNELNRLRDAVAEAIGRVRGSAALQYDPGVLHLTLAYASGDADSDVVQRRLRRVRPSHAPMTIESVHLVEVLADPDAKTITWAPPHVELALGSR